MIYDEALEALLKMGMRAFIDDAEQKQSAKENVNFAFASLPEYKVLEKALKLGKLYKELSELKDRKMRIMDERHSAPLMTYYRDIGFATQDIFKKEKEIEELKS